MVAAHFGPEGGEDDFFFALNIDDFAHDLVVDGFVLLGQAGEGGEDGFAVGDEETERLFENFGSFVEGGGDGDYSLGGVGGGGG